MDTNTDTTATSAPATPAEASKTSPAKTSATKSPKAPKAAKVAGEQTAAQKRSATLAAKRQARIEQRGYALPLVLTCKVTGKVVKYTSPAYISKVIDRYGSLKELEKNFISREGKRIQAEKAAATKPAKPAAAATS